MTKDKTVLQQKIYELLCLALILALAGIFVWANLFHYTAYMDSDIGAEALLARRIAECGFTTPATWRSSTEVRVVSTPNLAAYLYPLTGSMNIAMGIACTLFLFLLLMIMYRFYRHAGLSRAGAFTAVLLPLALTGNVHDGLQMFALYACYYGGHIAALFYTADVYGSVVAAEGNAARDDAAACACAVEAGEKKRTKDGRLLYLRMGLCVLIAFLMGRQGMRGVLIVYAPLAASEILRMIVRAIGTLIRRNRAGQQERGPREKGARGWTSAVFVFFCAALSFVTAKTCVPYGAGISRNLRRGPAKLFGTVFPQIAEVFGADGIRAVLSALLAAAAACGFILLTAHWLRCGSRAEHNSGSCAEGQESLPDMNRLLPVLLSFLASAAAGAFTTIDSTPRYYVMALFATGAGAGVLYDLAAASCTGDAGTQAAPMRARTALRRALGGLVLIIGIYAALADRQLLIASDRHADSDDAALTGYLMERGYERGYATFDHANRLTAVCDGAVLFASVEPETLEATRWLSDAVFYPPLADAGERVFFAATDASVETFRAALASKGITDCRTEKVGRYHLFFPDRDVAYWKE